MAKSAKPGVKSAAKKSAAKKSVIRKPVAKKPTVAKKVVQPPARAATKSSGVKAAPSRAADKQRFTLYGSNLSGPTYTVALMLSLSRQPFSYIYINLREGQHKQPDYLVKNRYGQIPALRDGHNFIVQSAAIVDYLSESLKKFEGKTPLEKVRIREWLFWVWDKLSVPLYRLRARNRGYRQFGDEVRIMYDTETRAALAALEHELSRSEWMVGKRPTIADIVIYAIVRYAPEAMVDLQAYPHILAWRQRVEALPGFGTPEQLLPIESRLL